MYRRILSLFLILTILVLGTFSATAATSDELKEELELLEEDAASLSEQLSGLEDELDALTDEALNYTTQKYLIDCRIALLYESIANTQSQVHALNLLISQQQSQLDCLREEYDELLGRYALRMRSLQEQGQPDLWTVLFSSDSYEDYLLGSVMIEEIARADQAMIADLQESAQQVLLAKDALAEDRAALALKKEALQSQEAELELQRAASDQLLAQINASSSQLQNQIGDLLELENQLHEEIAAKEQEYNDALAAENAAKFPVVSESGFLFPLDPSGFVCITDPYGMRYHPITGEYKLHNGTDFAAYQYTEIYASKSGVVTVAGPNEAWGNYVVINHGDGFSTLYAHMIYDAVSVGDVVTQGQVIGYVGSTGYSNGPHLHFTIYLNGSSVNPMNYLSLP